MLAKFKVFFGIDIPVKEMFNARKVMWSSNLNAHQGCDIFFRAIVCGILDNAGHDGLTLDPREANPTLHQIVTLDYYSANVDSCIIPSCLILKGPEGKRTEEISYLPLPWPSRVSDVLSPTI